MTAKAIEGLVEARIREARANGAFDDLPGAGRPLELDDMRNLTPEQRLEALVLRSAGEVSEEVLLLREIRERREALARCTDPIECSRLRDEMQTRALAVSALFEASRKQSTAAARNKGEP